jgi:hypothetical protein
MLGLSSQTEINSGDSTKTGLRLTEIPLKKGQRKFAVYTSRGVTHS